LCFFCKYFFKIKNIFRFQTKNILAPPSLSLAPSGIGGLNIILIAPTHKNFSAPYFYFSSRALAQALASAVQKPNSSKAKRPLSGAFCFDAAKKK
jgi:hypothetical protein